MHMSKDPQKNPMPHQDPGDPAQGNLVGGTAAGRPGTEPAPATTAEDPMRVTRSGVMWTATVLALVLLVLLIIFIAQNTNTVDLQYFGLRGTVQLGLALFVAAVGGGIVVAIAGAARIVQLRAIARKGKAKPKAAKKR